MTGPARKPDGVPEIVADAQWRVRERSPHALLAMASQMIEMTTPRPLDGWGGGRSRVDAGELFFSFAKGGWPSLAALAGAVAAIHPDPIMAERIRKDVGEVPHPPVWLAGIGTITVTDCVVQGHVLGDGENVVLSWRWPNGQVGTVVVYIDHNMGTIVKDAFTAADNALDIMAAAAQAGGEEIVSIPIAREEARARIEQALTTTDHMVPPIETDSWPSCRPIVEWLLRTLPSNGVGYVRPDWPEAERERLLDEFVASRFGKVRGLTPTKVREFADPLVWFGCDYGPGDPLRWSSVSVEIVLTDWYPRKVFAFSSAELRHLPDVLAAFVRFAHDRLHITPDLTAETVAAVELWRSDFLRAIARPGRSPAANATRIARLAAGFDEDEDDEDLGDEADYMGDVVRSLEANAISAVGGQSAWDNLDERPLGSIPFDWTKVPAECADLTAETVALMDQWSSELFDDEIRSISRVVLGEVLANDGSVFKRSPRADALAAATLSFVTRHVVSSPVRVGQTSLPWRVNTQKGLSEATGVSVSTISSRSKTISNVVERCEIDWPNMLHSIQRAHVLRTKQIVAEWYQSHPNDRR
jgi:hypothetical protein